MISHRKVLVCAVLSILLSGLAVGLAAAAPDASKSAQFATVDLERAFDSYNKKETLEKELATEFGQVKAWFDLRADNKLLSDEDFNQLVALKGKAQPTDEEKKKTDDITNRSKQLEQEFTSLQQKSGPTPEESARLKDLQAQINRIDATLKEESKKKDEELGRKRVELSRQVMKDVEAVVSTVAQSKGLAMVFNKPTAEPGLVVYSSLDITDEVIKKLNK